MEVVVGQRFRNLKKGSLYQVVALARDCTNARDGQAVVVYASVNEPERVFVREKNEFFEKFEAV